MIGTLRKRLRFIQRRFEELSESKKGEYIWVGNGDNPCKDMR